MQGPRKQFSKQYRQHTGSLAGLIKTRFVTKTYVSVKRWLRHRWRSVFRLANPTTAAAGWMKKLWQLQQDDSDSIELQSLVGCPSGQNRAKLSIPTPAAAHTGNGSGFKTQAKRGVMHARAATKFQQLNISYKSREELQRQENIELPKWVLHPHEFFAQCWWTFISCTVMVALFVDPFSLAFAQYPGLYPPTAPDTVFTVICTLLYACDVALNFVVAYYEDGVLVTDLHCIAAHYTSTHLWADLVTTIPFDLIILQIAGLQTIDSIMAWYISLLRLLRLGRVYRLYSWVQLMTYNQTFSLLAVTLARNFALCFYTVHLGACGFWYIAKQNGFSATSWVGANQDWVGTGTAVDKWWWSMYWSIITFSTVGYGDLHAYNVAEAIFVVLYMFVSIGVAAYFVGTSVLLVQENERKTGAYRESLMLLDEYSSTHDIPQSLKADMKGHLQLHFSSADLSDEAVLGVYPTTIRQRILRHLYSSPMASCWLFKSCQQKFLDALLAAAKVELYMPQVDIVTAGDQVNELHLIVAGQAVVERLASADVITDGLLLVVDGAGQSSGDVGQPVALGPGDSAGEMAFFTEMPCLESVRTAGVCRVLTIPRSVYNSVAADFPVSSSTVLDNLVARAEQMIKAEFRGPATTRILGDMDSLTAGAELLGIPGTHFDAALSSVMGAASSPINGNSNGSSTAAGTLRSWHGGSVPAANGTTRSSTLQGLRRDSVSGGLLTPTSDRLREMQQYLSSGQQQVVTNLLRVRALVKASRARMEQQRTHEFLNACSGGNLERMRMMLQQGCSVGCCDYDGRSGLVLAASKGHSLAVKLLLLSGAEVNAQDRLGSNALLEAVKAGHDEVIDLLLAAGGRLPVHGAQSAALLCAAVSEGDLALLRRLLHAGADPNVGDYDKRTALHIAAADCNLPVVKLLVEVGAVDPCLTDRWQQTALDEARKSGAVPVVTYLAAKVPAAEAAKAQLRSQQSQMSALLEAARQGQAHEVVQLLQRGCFPDTADPEGRTALMVAAAHGQQAVVSVLLAAGANVSASDALAGCSIPAAVRKGQDTVTTQLRAALPLLAVHVQAVVSALLAAGANVNASDALAGCSLLAAVRKGHDTVIQQLVSAGAKLQLPQAELSSALCNAVAACDVQLLRRYLAAGADVSVRDYNRQTALHVAAAQGKLDMVKLLVEQGHASTSAVDRFGQTPLDEAQRAGAADAVAYFTAIGSSSSRQGNQNSMAA